jgi:hypothetical protein
MSESRTAISGIKRSTPATPLTDSLVTIKRACILDLFSQHQLETLDSELKHERSLRAMDQLRFEQTQRRLEQQATLALQEANEASRMLDAARSESEHMTNQLARARNKALEELRQCQMDLIELQQNSTFSETHDELRLSRETCRVLQERVDAHAEKERRLVQELEELRDCMRANLNASDKQQEPTSSSSTSSPAPAGVLTELNKVRRQCADAERRARQYERAVQELNHRNQTLLEEREEARTAGRRVATLEQEMREVQVRYETKWAQQASWEEFQQRLGQVLKRQLDGPPEIATIIRFLEEARTQADEMEQLARQRLDESILLRENANEAVKQVRELQTTVDEKNDRITILENMLQVANGNLAARESQISIYKRETESLRALIKTFDDMPIKTDLDQSPKLDRSLQTTRVRLETLNEELTLMTAERDRLARQLEESTAAREEGQQELTRVKGKFEKLKEALLAERAKAEAADARANQAEALAGRGSFNPETTRVLHLKESPLLEALKEEINILRRQLVTASGEKNKAKLAPDPEKLNQRLKENFKEQIAHFREGVYLMTGFKVDMLPGTDRPTFRVRSVFSEQEQDHLMLKWPKGEKEGDVSSLDMLNTDFAKALSTTHSSDYMTKYKCLPAFMASVQLSLFEKQTMMM